MTIFIVGILALLLGYLFYSKMLERILKPFKSPTPAYTQNDGVDYIPMSKWKNHMIELLNIAGTGPIFGALMGAKWGPVAFLWIIAGSVLGGAVHDYMSGMMSIRNGGKSISKLMPTYLGKKFRYVILVLMVAMLILVSAMMAKSASELLVILTDVPAWIWFILVSAYFLISAVLPIDKVIGNIYPIFGILLVVMAVSIIIGLAVGGYEFPAMTLENLHPQGEDIFPDMCITIACGAISGFHATQSTLAARCVREEKDGRIVFYGAMLVEAFIALIWVTAGLTFYPDTASLSDALKEFGASGVVYNISTALVGPLGGVLAVIGVVICPITSGDTAIRSIRMMIQDDRDIETNNLKLSIIITGVAIALMIMLCLLDFQSLWYYSSWINQTIACITLWTCTAFLLKCTRRRIYSLVTALPAIFMTMVTVSFILKWEKGLNLDSTIAYVVGAIVTIALTALYIRAFLSAKKEMPQEPSQEYPQ